MNKNYLWLIPLTLAFPLLQVSIFAIRFAGVTPEIMLESLVFAPMGLFSGMVLIYLLRRPTQRVSVITGYLIAIPIALMSALVGGVLLPPLLGVTLFGALPLIAGCIIGYALGGSSR